jgi:hypothetical protein
MDAEANGPLKSWITNQSDGSRNRWRRASVAWPKPTENWGVVQFEIHRGSNPTRLSR